VVLAGAAFLSRQWFADQFAVSATYIFLYPAVLVTSMLAGVLPGLLATAVTVLLAALWIFPPFGALWPLATADLLSLGIYTVMAVLICLTSGYYRRMQKRIRVLETEQARRESEDRFRALADNIAQLAWMADATGARFWYNRRWFDYTGTALEQVQGWDWQQVHHPDHVRRVVDKLGSSLRDGEVWEDTFPLRGKDGSYRWFLARAVPIRNAQGEVERWFGTNTDVTDLRDAEEALRVAKEAAEEASRAKDEFLAIVSHELRTPMTVIMGALEHLLTAGPDPEQRRKLLEMADSSAHRLLGIINDLLDFTTLESHQLKIDLRPFDLRQSVRAAAEMYLRPAGEKGLRLRWEVAQEIPAQIVGDPARLDQVLTNLLDNAVKFTDRGDVALTVTGSGGELAVAVRDTGIGIPAANQERIFEPFSQVDSSSTRRYGGTGLGLAICRELVVLMGGTLRVESEVGRGSVFSFTLPLPPAVAGRPRAQTEPSRERAAPSGRILLAEDDPVIQQLVALLLHRKGWEVTLVENGRQAVERWQRGGIDLVLMDIQMPVMGGLEATRQIRRAEHGQGRRTHIVGLTAHARPEEAEAFLAAGMDEILIKPFRSEELEALVGNFLGRPNPPA